MSISKGSDSLRVAASLREVVAKKNLMFLLKEKFVLWFRDYLYNKTKNIILRYLVEHDHWIVRLVGHEVM